MGYRGYSETYDYDDVNVAIPPTLPAGIKQHVFVTHDESTFYANDHQQYAWLEKNESFILPKSQGRSIMISEFHCPCHGTMRAVINGRTMTSRVVFYPGAAYQGYWTSDHMIAQLTDVLELFEYLHEGMVGVFLFDQSSNHKAYAKNALVASRMNMGPHEVPENEVKVRDTFFNTNEGVQKTQTFYKRKNFDYPEFRKLQCSKLNKITKIAKINKIFDNVHAVSFFYSNHYIFF
jgi:hypothetical protein